MHHTALTHASHRTDTRVTPHQHSSPVASDPRVSSQVASLTEVTLTQTAEIFRLNEMVIRMDSELREVRSKLHIREMGIEEAMMRWHADDGEDPFGTECVLRCAAVCCGVLRCVAVCCGVF